jgi:branched-chain amino acid transport system permease protein
VTAAHKSLLLHGAIIAVLAVMHFILPAYHHGNLARILVLSCFAMGYNLLFGYTGLLSLGHALFFSAGMYGMGLAVQHLGFTALPAFAMGIAAALAISAISGFLALRTGGVAFMIVTLMFAQSFYLSILYFGEWTRGDEGFVIDPASRILAGFDLSVPANRYLAALLFFSFCLLIMLRLVHSPTGRVLVAIRENEQRAQMLGYDIFRYKLLSVVISGTMSGAAGAAYGLLFGYAGATFASVQYSILPLLWVLLGGAGTVVGPFAGTLFML